MGKGSQEIESLLVDSDVSPGGSQEIESLLGMPSAQAAPVIEPVSRPRVTEPRTGQALLESFGRGLTFGALPALQAVAEPVTSRIFGALTGQEADTGTFEQRRAENIARQQALQQEAPVASLAGEIAGAIPAIAGPQALAGRAFQGLRAAQGLGRAAQAARLAGRAGTAAGTGAAIGFLQAPEPEEEMSLQLSERFKGAGKGALGGLAFQAGGEALGGVGRLAARQAPKLALRSAGAFKSTIKKLFRKTRPKFAERKLNELGNTILDNRLVRAGDTIEDVAARTTQLRERIGRRIGDVTRRTNETVNNPQFQAALTPAQQTKLAETSLRPQKLAEEMLEFVNQKFRGQSGFKQALGKAQSIADDLIQLGDDADIADIQRFKTSLGNTINFGTPTFKTDKQVAEGLRKFLRDKVRDRISFLDDVLKTDDVAQLKRSDALFNKISELEDITIEKLSSDAGNNFFSVRDTFLGGTIGIGAGLRGEEFTPESLGRAALLGVGGGLLSRGARRFAPALATRAAQGLIPLQAAAQAPLVTGALGGVLAQ